MNKLITKARSGVTLVELLVVILIVTILSVSMLPLLQPFVVEAQYAAEAIPVIGNLRTKIGVYQYDKGKLPCYVENSVGTDGKDTGKLSGTPQIETWIPTQQPNQTTAADASKVDYYSAAVGQFPSSVPPLQSVKGFGVTGEGESATDNSTDRSKHLEVRCDIDYQELKGKRSKPHHYQYLVMRNGTDYAYFIGCFGDGNGLKMGTGYAVCEIVAAGHKYVGTWKRYKPVSIKSGEGENAKTEDAQVCFTSSAAMTGNKTCGCWVPTKDTIENAQDANGKLNIITTMEGRGWEF